MRAVKSKGSKIETKLSKGIWHLGYRFKKNNKNVYGVPDISISKYKIAIFCDSEFWHGKDWETKKHEIKSNKDFWHKKIEGNIRRDTEVNQYLKKNGWLVLRFWGNEIEKEFSKVLSQIDIKIRHRITSCK